MMILPLILLAAQIVMPQPFNSQYQLIPCRWVENGNVVTDMDCHQAVVIVDGRDLPASRHTDYSRYWKPRANPPDAGIWYGGKEDYGIYDGRIAFCIKDESTYTHFQIANGSVRECKE